MRLENWTNQWTTFIGSGISEWPSTTSAVKNLSSICFGIMTSQNHLTRIASSSIRHPPPNAERDSIYCNILTGCRDELKVSVCLWYVLLNETVKCSWNDSEQLWRRHKCLQRLCTTDSHRDTQNAGFIFKWSSCSLIFTDISPYRSLIEVSWPTLIYSSKIPHYT